MVVVADGIGAMEPGKTGADLIAEFIARFCSGQVFLVTGGACAFIVDALDRNPRTQYVCFQHEQAAAMAADAVWRVTEQIGVTVATSGPGATNLVTGIACSWFDSIPSLHITGQVNDAESRGALGVNVRQAGFQETDIVGIVAPITKLAIQVHSISELIAALRSGVEVMLSDRMGPALVDVPMNVQKAPVSKADWESALLPIIRKPAGQVLDWNALLSFLEPADRPLVVIGGGAVPGGTIKQVQRWCELSGLPYVSSWSSMPHLDRSQPLYLGSQGVYGSRIANRAIQGADKILVLGSRLDNRQRSGNPNAYAPFAEIMVFDVDSEELGKFSEDPNYRTIQADLTTWGEVPAIVDPQRLSWSDWRKKLIQGAVRIQSGTEASVQYQELSPYRAVSIVQSKMAKNAIVVSDCGANLCWVYQEYPPNDTVLFTAAGNSPMGYALPAAMGAQLCAPERQVWCFIGDGGLQMNIQELQTVSHLKLPIIIVVLNNRGYGIIKQFQDTYFGGRYAASGDGYSVPDFERIATAYGISYVGACTEKDLANFEPTDGPILLDISIPEGALITPKLEIDRFLHDQFPYDGSDAQTWLPYDYPLRPSDFESFRGPDVQDG